MPVCTRRTYNEAGARACSLVVGSTDRGEHMLIIGFPIIADRTLAFGGFALSCSRRSR
jgi:hypothetical protein